MGQTEVSLEQNKAGFDPIKEAVILYTSKKNLHGEAAKGFSDGALKGTVPMFGALVELYLDREDTLCVKPDLIRRLYNQQGEVE